MGPRQLYAARLALAFIPPMLVVSTVGLTYALGWSARNSSFTLSDIGCRGSAQVVFPIGVFLYSAAFVLATFLVQERLGASVFAFISAIFAILNVLFRNCEFDTAHDVLGSFAVFLALLHMCAHLLRSLTPSKFAAFFAYIIAILISGLFYLFDSSDASLGFSIAESLLWFSHALFVTAILVDRSPSAWPRSLAPYRSRQLSPFSRAWP